MPSCDREPLGRILVGRGLISEAQLHTALSYQQDHPLPLGRILLDQGALGSEEDLLGLIAQQQGRALADPLDTTVDPALLAKVSPSTAAFYQVVPLGEEDGILRLAAADPESIDLFEALSLELTGPFELLIAAPGRVREAVRKYYGVGADTVQRLSDDDAPAGLDLPAVEEDDPGADATIGRFVRQLLQEAVRENATDVHIESAGERLYVRTRIDGVMHDLDLPPRLARFRDAIFSRIKILARLNIAERRLPQDGRARLRLGEDDLDLRVSFLPGMDGESLVIRILNASRLFDLGELGLSAGEQSLIEGLIRRPHGLIFVTGPTGSGKTTTLYSCLTRLNTPARKIITIEDPVEYRLSRITQVQVNPETGLTFARGLRSMLRHDPDVMMVGEVRDLETARIAVQIALTGHLVFSTLHTNDAAGGVARLLDMGVEPFLINGAVACFIAQRLVRRICPNCREEETDPAVHERWAAAGGGTGAVFRGRGCAQCRQTGYRGREAIYEFLPLDDRLRALIFRRAPMDEIRAHATSRGHRDLLGAGRDKVRAGITTPEEILRVTEES